MRPLTADDLAAIGQLAAGYAHHVDAGDAEGLAGIFAADAVFAVYGAEHAPRSTVIAFLLASARGTHVVGAPLVSVSPDGLARGSSRFVFVNATTGAVIAGGYEDSYVLRDGEWRIARRAVAVPAPAHA